MSNLNDDFSADFETHLRELKYIPIFKEFSKYDNKMIRYTIESKNWRIQPSVFLIDLNIMSNVASIYLLDFSGCEFTIKISESKNGPYVDVYTKKYFTKSKEKKINMFSLPCQYIRIECIKGNIDLRKMKIFGFTSDDVESVLGKNTFSLLVHQPKKILYDF